jgi:hypothetical protein
MKRDIKKCIEKAKKIYYAYEYYNWGARHFEYSKIVDLKAPAGCLIIRLKHHPYGQGSQWDICETLVLVFDTTSTIPTAEMESFRRDCSLLERCPPGKSSQSKIYLEEISKEKALSVYNNYLQDPPDKVSIEIQKVE